MSSTYWRQKHVQHHQSCGRNCQWLNKKKQKEDENGNTDSNTISSINIDVFVNSLLRTEFSNIFGRRIWKVLLSLLPRIPCVPHDCGLVCVWMLRVLIKSNLKAKTFVAYQNDDHQEEVVPSHPIRIENIWFKDLQVPMRLNAFNAFWGEGLLLSSCI